MVIDLCDNHHNKPKLALENSNSTALTQVIDTPLDDVSNSDDQTHITSYPTGNISQPPFYTKLPSRLNNGCNINFFQNENKPFITTLITILSHLHPSTVQNSTLPISSTVTTNPNDYPIDNTSNNNDNGRPVNVYSKTNYPFTPPSF